MRPKPDHIYNFTWLSIIWLIAIVSPHNTFGQQETDSLTIDSIVEDSISLRFSELDSLEIASQQLADKQLFKNNVKGEIDSTYNARIDKLNIPKTEADSLIDNPILKKVLPKSSDLEISNQLGKIDNPVNDQKIDVPKIQFIEIDNIDKGVLKGKRNEITKLKSDVKSNLQVKQGFDSLNRESIENKAEQLAKDNIDGLQELDQMEGAANNARSQVKDLKWDKSKIKSSKNIAKVLSENVESVQSGMDKMKDFKGKYSKVNLMNPNGPVLKEISQKPTKPWQFSLNFSSQFQNGLSLQLAPTLGYKFHEKWIGGIGISYQLQIIDKDSSFALAPKQEFSHRIFNQFNFYRNFFLHLEHELPYSQRHAGGEKPWYNLDPQKPRGWAGLALQYGIYKNIKGQTQILYNIIKPDMATENRWTIRVNLIF